VDLARTKSYLSLLSSVGITRHDGTSLAVMPWGEASRRQAIADASKLARFPISPDDTRPIAELARIIRASLAGVDAGQAIPSPASREPVRFDVLRQIDGRFVDPGKNIDWSAVENVLQAHNLTAKAVAVPHDLSEIINTSEVIGSAEVCDPNGFVWGGGKGLSPDSAFRGALAEAIERLVASSTIADQVFVASAAELKELGFSIPEWDVSMRDAYSEDVRIDWVTAYTSKGEAAAVPAERVFYQYIPRRGVSAFAHQHTAGLAAGATIEEAIWAGLTECLERDAYWTVMRCRMYCKTIPSELLNDIDANLLHAISASGFRIVLKDISLEWPIRIVHALLIDESSRLPAYAHGCGSHVSIFRAALNATMEALQMHAELARYCRAHLAEVQFPPHEPSLQTKSPRAAWSDPASAALLCHLSEDSDKMSRIDPLLNAELTPVEVLARVVDATGPILWAPLGHAGGLSVARVIVPGCQVPDHQLGPVSVRLRYWLAKCKITIPYAIPILT
jgi:ribosomal protein S12 methylthiotransferase accessory factor